MMHSSSEQEQEEQQDEWQEDRSSRPASAKSSSSHHGKTPPPHPGAPSADRTTEIDEDGAALFEPSRLMMSSAVDSKTHEERQRRRREFALLIKVLLKLLWNAGEVSLYHQVRLSIATCAKRNRMGDPSFSPLEDVLEAHLWLMVGDTYWEKATNLQQKYLQQRAAFQVPCINHSNTMDPSLLRFHAYSLLQQDSNKRNNMPPSCRIVPL